jgi:hypothetical protein
MTVVDQVPNELDKLLADVQRTIRQNDQFLRSLKKEAADSELMDSGEETDDDGEGYEEL